MTSKPLSNDRSILHDYTESDFIDELSGLVSRVTRAGISIPFAAESLCRSAGLLSSLEQISKDEKFPKKGRFKYYVHDDELAWDDSEVLASWKESWKVAYDSMSGGTLVPDDSPDDSDS